METSRQEEIARELKGLSPVARRKKLLRMKKDAKIELRSQKTELKSHKKQIRFLEQQVAAVNEIKDWLPDELVLEKAEGSKLPSMWESIKSGRIITTADTGFFEWCGESCYTKHAFVIKHDWAAVIPLKDSDEFLLPYDLCAFEFQVAGRRLIALAAQQEEEKRFTLFAQTRYCWVNLGDHAEWEDGKNSIWQHIKAICVALDAEVAEYEIVRASNTLNKKRRACGKELLPDHYVVDLSKRHRISNPSKNGEGSKKRLHFRRGHWRHYETHKTWIRWCLVGDPDLGFVSKEYTV